MKPTIENLGHDLLTLMPNANLLFRMNVDDWNDITHYMLLVSVKNPYSESHDWVFVGESQYKHRFHSSIEDARFNFAVKAKSIKYPWPTLPTVLDKLAAVMIRRAARSIIKTKAKEELGIDLDVHSPGVSTSWTISLKIGDLDWDRVAITHLSSRLSTEGRVSTYARIGEDIRELFVMISKLWTKLRGPRLLASTGMYGLFVPDL